MSKELFQIGAFHESGHAVIGYYMGFEIDDIILLESDPGSGRTKFNYGADSLVIAGILNAKKDPSFFNSLPKESRSRTSQATTKICCTLIAGGVAEAIHKQGIEFKGNLEIGFADPDADGIDACKYVMTIIDKTRSEKYIHEMVTNMTSIICSKENWDVINSLAEALLATANKTLMKSEIEAIFVKHDFKRMEEE
jgi:hypothetical protein